MNTLSSCDWKDVGKVIPYDFLSTQFNLRTMNSFNGYEGFVIIDYTLHHVVVSAIKKEGEWFPSEGVIEKIEPIDRSESSEFWDLLGKMDELLKGLRK